MCCVFPCIWICTCAVGLRYHCDYDIIMAMVVSIQQFNCVQINQSSSYKPLKFITIFILSFYSVWRVGWGCRIHRLHLCRRVRPSSNECHRHDTKQSDREVPVILELWEMQSISSLPLLPSTLWSGMVAPDRALSMG